MASDGFVRLSSGSHESRSPACATTTEVSPFEPLDDDPSPPQPSSDPRLSEPMLPPTTSSSSSSFSSPALNRPSFSRSSPSIHPMPAPSPSPPSHPPPATKSSLFPPPTQGQGVPPTRPLPRPSITVPISPRPYPSLLTPKSPPSLRPSKQSELALRLGDVMGEIHRHEKEKREVTGLTRRAGGGGLGLGDGEDGGGGGVTRRMSSADVSDWKPYEERKARGVGETMKGELEVKRPRQRDHSGFSEITVRERWWAVWVCAVLSDLRYQYASMALTLLCLYLHDLCYAAFPSSADDAVSGILLFTFIFFSLELLLQCVCRRNYAGSFFFFMDLIGTVSLIFDISFIVNQFWSTNPTTSSTASSHVTQSASVIRLTRFARVLRVIRLVRIVRLLRYNTPVSQSRHPSKVGLHLASLIDKRVILMMLGMVIILPFLTGDTAPLDQSPALGLELCADALSLQDMQAVVTQLVAAQGDSLFYLFIQGGPVAGASGLTLIDQRASTSGLRDEEVTIYTAGSSTLMLSVRESVYLTACYSMATTTLIIAVFASGSWLISRSVHTLVVAPLERMTQIIRKLAGTVCFLTAATEADAKELDDGLETNVIEATIEKMARIFAVQPDGNSALPKPLQMMAGSKHTEIMTNSSIVSIEVIERPKALTNETIVDDGSVPDDRSTWLDVDVQQHKELSSIDEILTHPLLIPYFDLYLSSCFVNENLQFSLEVDRFRSIIRTHALHLHNSFISPRAHNAINVDAPTKQRIGDELDDPTFSVFDEAQKECLDGMRGHWRSFLRSRWCRGYVRKAEETETRRKRLVKGKTFGGGSEVKEEEKGGQEGQQQQSGDVMAVRILPGHEGTLVELTSPMATVGSASGRSRSESDGAVGRVPRRQRAGTADFPGAVNMDGRLKEEDE